MAPKEYGPTLASLFARTADGFKLGLATTQSLLQELGLGGPSLPYPVVLVAGTNGKGATAAVIARALTAAGHRVGFFLSPHLCQFVERISVDGCSVRPEEVIELYGEIRAVEYRCPNPPTFFECATVMAASKFARDQVDVAIFEVGLGGRLDATNALPHPMAVITPIGLDHERFLGNSVEAIAAEKAATIPRNGIVVSAPQAEPVQQVLSEMARQRGARLVKAPPAPMDPAYGLPNGEEGPPPISPDRPWLPPFQRQNLTTAVAACCQLNEMGIQCRAPDIRTSLTHFDWPGRYQWLPGSPDALLDGAHNPTATRALVKAMALDSRIAGRPIHGVFSALRDKTAEKMLCILTPHLETVHLCPLVSRRGRTKAELENLGPRTARVCPHPEAALAAARELALRDNGVVLVTGSLLLVGQALSCWLGVPRDPPVDG